jgi:zinc and cadmium transporter
MDIFVFLALFVPVILSGLSVFIFRTNNKVLKLLTAFSGAYLLSISFLEIIPEIYHGQNGWQIGLFILLGFFIQLFLEFITRGVEHGHQHHDCNQHHPNEVHSGPHLPVFAVVVGLFIHAFLEGMPLAESFNMPQLRNTLLTGIAIHNIPIAIVLVSLSLGNDKKKLRVPLIALLVFAFAGPLGVLSSNLLGVMAAEDATWYFSVVMAMVVGIFLHISTTILFETDERHRFNWLKLLVVILGAGAAFLFSLQS